MINSYRGIITVDSEGAELQIHAILSLRSRREQGAGMVSWHPIRRGSVRILFVGDEPAIVKFQNLHMQHLMALCL